MGRKDHIWFWFSIQLNVHDVLEMALNWGEKGPMFKARINT